MCLETWNKLVLLRRGRLEPGMGYKTFPWSAARTHITGNSVSTAGVSRVWLVVEGGEQEGGGEEKGRD